MPEITTTVNSISERNARSAALGRYTRFLMKRYQRVSYVEMADITDPIELRQIFVEMRVLGEDIADERIGREVATIEQEALPGEDAWELLARERFVALSGRPGSGKSTLVQGVIAQLCSDPPGRLCQLLPVIPVPFILRDIPGIATVRSLEELFARWWPAQEAQADRDGFPLDRERLASVLEARRQSDLEVPPVLLLFDGIDEIGGLEIRQRLFDMAHDAFRSGYRVLVTGRPSGYRDLVTPFALTHPTLNIEGPVLGEDEIVGYEEGPRDDASAGLLELIQLTEDRVVAQSPDEVNLVRTAPILHHLAPFAGRQILDFMDRWYSLRDEWESKKKDGIARFLSRVADKSRPHLLSLARRPIFLTLMAVVHTTQNELPEGRALLYRRILDLYLERQERHRQRKETLEGTPAPHWPAAETRLVLGHLAWQSQLRGSEIEGPTRSRDSDERRVVWSRSEVEEVFRSQIQDGRLGRFATLTPGDAPGILGYFLHPAGLLIEPADGSIQFAHLSFQEYLCAWFLHERSKVDEERSPKEYLQSELFARLGRPGWDEVGILLLCIVAEETGNQGHFRTLRWLDLLDSFQARLYVNAVSGRELPFKKDERLQHLPVVVGSALVHPNFEFGESVAAVDEWKTELLDLVLRFLDHQGPLEQWAELRSERSGTALRALGERWASPPQREISWDSSSGATEARTYAILQLIGTAGLADPRDTSQPLSDSRLEIALAAWIEKVGRKNIGDLFWGRDAQKLPGMTVSGQWLDALLPDHGCLWRLGLQAVPLDAWLLQGIAPHDRAVFSDPCSQPTILLSLAPGEPLPPRSRLALTLYQALVALEGVGKGRPFQNWIEQRSQSKSQSQVVSLSQLVSLSLSQSRSLSLSLLQARSLSRSLSLSRSRSLSLSLSLSQFQPRSLSLSLSHLRAHLRLLSQTQTQLQLQSMLLSQAKSLLQALSLSLSQSLGNTRSMLARAQDRLTCLPDETYKEVCEPVMVRLIELGCKASSFEWFSIQAAEVDLARRRGLRHGEPLPRRFSLLDKRGHLLLHQPRQGWLGLREWLDDDKQILEFAFPGGDGLTAAEKRQLRADLKILRGQPWSPQAGIDAMLEGWPDREVERDISLDRAERELVAACESVLSTPEPAA